MVVKKKANVERSRAEFEAELHLLSIKNAVTWMKYCRYGLKFYPINQLYSYKKEAATTKVELRVLQEEGGYQLDALSDAVPERHNDLIDSHQPPPSPTFLNAVSVQHFIKQQ